MNRCVIILFTSLLMVANANAQAQDAGRELEGKLLKMTQQMTAIADSISENQLDQSLIEEQKKIIDELNLMIRQFSAGEEAGNQQNMQRESTQSTSAGEASSQGIATAEPQETSDDKGAESDVDARDFLNQVWGQMPDQTRGERQSGLSPEFLPRFDRMIREYYRRITR